MLLAGAGVTVHRADRDADGLDGTATLIENHGGTARLHVVDVTDRSRLAEAARSCGRLDVPAAIAGIMHSGPVLETRDAAKAAVVQPTRTPATELGPRGVRVNAVAPGWIRTP